MDETTSKPPLRKAGSKKVMPHVHDSAKSLALRGLLNNQAESRVVAWKGPVPKLKKWYQEGKDVHLETTLLIARIIQENKIKLYGNLFTSIPWNAYCDGSLLHKTCEHYRKGSEEREQTKRIIHGYNYEVGVKKVALILGVPEDVAKVLLTIYGTLNPEIKTQYQAGIERELKKSKTLWMPPPVEFRKVFWDVLNGDTLRQGYASYPQCIVGSMTKRTIAICSNIFREDKDEIYKDQWCVWYGTSNWDRWRHLRDSNIRTPQAILWSGMDIRLNIHDAGGISIPDDPDLCHWAGLQWKRVAETPIQITKEEPLVIPSDFKKGPTWGELEDYKVA